MDDWEGQDVGPEVDPDTPPKRSRLVTVAGVLCIILGISCSCIEGLGMVAILKLPQVLDESQVELDREYVEALDAAEEALADATAALAAVPAQPGPDYGGPTQADAKKAVGVATVERDRLRTNDPRPIMAAVADAIRDTRTSTFLVAFGALGLVFHLALIAIGVGLIRRKRWGWLLTVGVAGSKIVGEFTLVVFALAIVPGLLEAPLEAAGNLPGSMPTMASILGQAAMQFFLWACAGSIVPVALLALAFLPGVRREFTEHAEWSWRRA